MADRAASKRSWKEALWAIPGLVFLLLVSLIVFQYYERQDTAAVTASRSRRAELVAAMSFNLAAASEAEKSAVLAVTDKDSSIYADQARAATAVVTKRKEDLAMLLATGGSPLERELLARFEKAFGDFERIDHEVLDLAVKNTNIKAFDLAFGPAASALADFDAALSRVAARSAGSPRTARTGDALACGARIGALRIQALLAPHIAEASDSRMDELEARMTKEDEAVRSALAALAALGGGPDIDAAVARYERFGQIRTRIIALSRENTNVRSLNLSLDQKKKAMLACQEVLSSLKRAIDEEPMASSRRTP